MDRSEMILDSMSELRDSLRGMTADLGAAKSDAGRKAIGAAIADARRMYSVLATEAKGLGVHPDVYQFVGGHYTHQEMVDAFARLDLGANWKVAIDCLIPRAEFDAVAASIDYFCGGGVVAGFTVGAYQWIIAPGYYAQIGA